MSSGGSVDAQSKISLKSEDLEPEYSASIKPLTFKKVGGDRRENREESLSQVRAQLRKSTAANGSGVADSNCSNGQDWFHSVDLDQYESFLKNPKYIKTFSKKQGLDRFQRLFLAQELNSSSALDDGATLGSKPKVQHPSLNPEGIDSTIWTSKFTSDGKYLLTGSKDGTLRVWKVISSPAERWELDAAEDMHSLARTKSLARRKQVSPSSSVSSLTNVDKTELTSLYAPVFHPRPFRVYKEHTHDILDIDCSNGDFVVSASMDRAARVWNLQNKHSLRSFIHPDFVTCCSFHPVDNRFFITGCLDHVCRLWSILDDEVCFEYDSKDVITALAFSSDDDAKYTIIGTFNGYIHILLSDGLEYVASFHVGDKRTRTSNPFARDVQSQNGPRITGVECLKTTHNSGQLKIMVTSDDSKIRIFDLDDEKVIEILRGFTAVGSQHKAQFTNWQNQPIVLTGSNDHWVYTWPLQSTSFQHTTKEQGESSSYHRSSSLTRGGYNDENAEQPKTHGLHKLFNSLKKIGHHDKKPDAAKNTDGNHSNTHLHLNSFIPSGNYSGSSPVRNGNYICFHAHHAPVTTALVAPTETSSTLSLSDDFIHEASLEYRKEATIEENSNMDKRLTAMDDIINTIIVTTDNLGTIRVFRTDLAPPARKMVLRKLQERKKSLNDRNSSTISPASKNERSFTSLFSHGATFSNPKMSLDHPADAFKHTNVVETVVENKQQTMFPDLVPVASSKNTGSASSATIDASSNLQDRTCSTCQGTEFQRVPKSSRGWEYICRDCGTVLNEFR